MLICADEMLIRDLTREHSGPDLLQVPSEPDQDDINRRSMDGSGSVELGAPPGRGLQVLTTHRLTTHASSLTIHYSPLASGLLC